MQPYKCKKILHIQFSFIHKLFLFSIDDVQSMENRMILNNFIPDEFCTNKEQSKHVYRFAQFLNGHKGTINFLLLHLKNLTKIILQEQKRGVRIIITIIY